MVEYLKIKRKCRVCGDKIHLCISKKDNYNTERSRDLKYRTECYITCLHCDGI